MKIAGIPRNPKNSPNMSDKDMQLFNRIVEELKNHGHTVEILDEQQEISNEYDAIFHMTRTADTLEKLASCEAKGIYVTNSANGVRNCSREKFVEIFTENKIKQPIYTRINIASEDCTPPFLPGWLKKATDGRAMTRMCNMSLLWKSTKKHSRHSQQTDATKHYSANI